MSASALMRRYCDRLNGLARCSRCSKSLCERVLQSEVRNQSSATPRKRKAMAWVTSRSLIQATSLLLVLRAVPPRLERTEPVLQGPSLLVRQQAMELSGALSNPRETHKSLLKRLLHGRQQAAERASSGRRAPRTTPPRRTALLDTAEAVLRGEGRPMRVSELCAAATMLLRADLHRSAMKQALSANVNRSKPRFRRVSHGVYALAEPGGKRI
jgi:hypothetical protein